MITYRIRPDEAFYKTTIDRYDQQRPRYLRYATQYLLAGLILATIWVTMTRPLTEQVIFQSLAIAVATAIGGVFVTKLGILWRFKRRFDFGQEFDTVISDEGIKATGAHVQSTWTWPAYPCSVRFRDGILLMKKGAIRWMPDAAIISGDADSATALVSANTAMRRLDG